MKFYRGFKHTEETRAKMKGRKAWNAGIKIDKDKYPNMGHYKPHTENTKKVISKKKRENPTRFWLGKKKPEVTKWLNSPEANKKRVISMTGSKNPNWKGGTSVTIHSIRKSAEYRLWRKSVFERDNYTCVWCGVRGVELNADHIKPFSLFPELRFAIDNGRALCVPCHRTTDTFSHRINKYNKHKERK